MRAVLFVIPAILLLCAARRPSGLSFGEHYPHTRWIDRETHSVIVDAFTDRIVVSGQRGGLALTMKGCWRGRAFLSECRSDFFAVTHEGVDATFLASPLKDYHFRRVRPDPT